MPANNPGIGRDASRRTIANALQPGQPPATSGRPSSVRGLAPAGRQTLVAAEAWLRYGLQDVDVPFCGCRSPPKNRREDALR